MSMWIDQKYIGLLSVKLDRFSRKDSYTYNFRCPICGDSRKNKTKTRGYIFPKTGGLFYKCHNCQASMSFGNLIKEVDPILYKEYCLERYKSGETGNKPHKEHGFVFKPVVFPSSKKDNALKKYLTNIKNLTDDHFAKQYVIDRMIPESRYEDIYFVDDEQLLKNFAEGYEDKIKGNEPRLILPFFNENDELVGITGRALKDSKIRYLVVKIKDDDRMVFNINKVDKNKPIFVTEGPIDSLFLSNSVSLGNASLQQAAEKLPKENLILVYDNEPRNKEIVREIKSAIDNDFRVCIWPKNILQKDINDMIKDGGLTPSEVEELINKNTLSGPRALLEFNLWRIT